MKRCILSLSIMLVLTAFCVCSLFIIRSECRNYAAMTDAVILSIESNDTEAALSYFDELQNSWDEFHDICGLFVSGAKFDPIRDLLSGMRPLLEAEHPEAISELKRLRSLIESIFEEEKPVLWHIL